MEIGAAVKIGGGAKYKQMKWNINTNKNKNIDPFNHNDNFCNV